MRNYAVNVNFNFNYQFFNLFCVFCCKNVRRSKFCFFAVPSSVVPSSVVPSSAHFSVKIFVVPSSAYLPFQVPLLGTPFEVRFLPFQVLPLITAVGTPFQVLCSRKKRLRTEFDATSDTAKQLDAIFHNDTARITFSQKQFREGQDIDATFQRKN